MKRLLLLALLCSLFLSAGKGNAEIVSHPLAGNDPYLPPHSVAGQDGLLGLYVNPAALAMRPGELGLLYFQGLRGYNDMSALDEEFASRYTGDWSLVAGGSLAFGIDRGRSVGGFDYDFGGVPADSIPRLSRYWRYNLGLSHRFVLPGWDSELSLGAAYRWTRSDAYALDRLGSWDLGALFRWRRWLSLGLSARNIDRPTLRPRFPGESLGEREIAPSYLVSLALRPKADWVTASMDVLQTEIPNGWEYETHLGLALSLSNRVDLRLGWSDKSRYRAAIFLSQNRWRAGGNLGNQGSASEGSTYGAFSLEWRNRRMGRPLLPNRHFLELSLHGPIPEAPPGPSLFSARIPCTRDILDLIRRARRERDVAGILLRLEDPELGMAQAEEIRAALLEYRRVTGKPVIFYSHSYSTDEYYLATAGSHIAVNPEGELLLTGLSLGRPYLRGALDKLGVEAQMQRHGSYKSGLEILTRKGPSPATIEADSTFLQSRYSTLRRAIAEERKLDLTSIAGLIDRAHYYPQTARDRGLVDATLHPDQLKNYLTENGGAGGLLGARDLKARRYSKERWGQDPAFALIYVTGMIMTGESGTGLFGQQTGAATVAAALKRARENPRIRGVLLRVDSGGGGGMASELMAREIQRTRLEKPVVVSMGNAAASGGYLISVEGTRILADRSTVTGSIGVFGGKFYLRGMFEKLGITFAGVSAGEHAHLNSSLHPYSEEERETLQARLDHYYDKFVGRVSERRHISKPEVNLIARGRIWSGEDAIQLGLLDALGGMEAALTALRREAGIPPDRDVELIVLPARRGLFSALFRGDAARAGWFPSRGETLPAWLERLDPTRGERVLYYEPTLGPLPLLPDAAR